MKTDSPMRWVRKQVFGLTQQEMAEIGGVSRSRMSRYESGRDRPPYDVLDRIRKAARDRGLALSADAFFEVPAPAPEMEPAE